MRIAMLRLGRAAVGLAVLVFLGAVYMLSARPAAKAEPGTPRETRAGIERENPF